MNHIPLTVAAAALMLVFAQGATAQANMDPETMTCGDFKTMTTEDQALAMTALKDATDEADITATTGTATDIVVIDSTTGTATDIAVIDSTDDNATAEMSPEVQALITACQGSDAMTAAQAMKVMYSVTQ
jgi:hypothetical protein